MIMLVELETNLKIWNYKVFNTSVYFVEITKYYIYTVNYLLYQWISIFGGTIFNIYF